MLPALFGGRRRVYLIRLIAIGIVQAVVGAGGALLVRAAFDAMAATGQPEALRFSLTVAGTLIALALASGWLRAAERAEAERLGQAYANAVRLRLHDRLLTYPPRALQGRSQGGVLLRFVGDAGAVRQWVSLGISRLIVSGLTAVGVLASLAMLNGVLAAGVGLAVAAGAALLLYLGRALRAASQEARRRKSNLAANISRQVGGLAVVQVHGQADRERRRLARQSRKLRDAAVARARIGGRLQGVAEAAAALAAAITLALGSIEAGAGRATPGTVAAALAIVGLLAPSLRDLSRVEEYRRTADVAFARIREFLADDAHLEDRLGALPLRDGPGRVEFVAVTVPGALAGVSAVASPGARIALVGPNGAGKSSLLALACRLLDPATGAVMLDGQDLSDCTIASVRRAVGIVGTDYPLLRGTVAENLRYRWPDATDHQLARIRALCGVDTLLADLPEGAETRLVDGGMNLSVGQRQRIALARALLGEPRLLLMDEADASLDPVAAAAIDRVLAEFAGTVILVTHRSERLDGVDAIWHLDRGKLIEAGPPPEVLARVGPTRRLFARLAS